MKADANPATGGGGEREQLRSLLRHWQVPAPPPDLEDELRRTFRRRRRSRSRPLVWLSLAAGLTLVLLSRVEWPARPAAPARAEARSPSPPPLALPAPRAARIETESPRPAAAPLAHPDPGRGPLAAARPEPEVVVEPGQGELLAELSRSLRGVQAGPPGEVPREIAVLTAHAPEPPIPRLDSTEPPSETPPYRADWEAVGDWLVPRIAEGGR